MPAASAKSANFDDICWSMCYDLDNINNDLEYFHCRKNQEPECKSVKVNKLNKISFIKKDSIVIIPNELLFHKIYMYGDKSYVNDIIYKNDLTHISINIDEDITVGQTLILINRALNQIIDTSNNITKKAIIDTLQLYKNKCCDKDSKKDCNKNCNYNNLFNKYTTNSLTYRDILQKCIVFENISDKSKYLLRFCDNYYINKYFNNTKTTYVVNFGT
jgi:hypothetical protein